jgi:predicted PurR-regulated permease PerM
VTTNDETNHKTSGLVSVCLTVALLYFARDILKPIALAILLAFLLEPLALRFERMAIGRVASVFAAVALAILAIGGLSYLLIGQFSDFGKEFPKYERTIHQKLRALQATDGNIVRRATKSIHDFRKDLAPTNSIVSTNTSLGITNNVPESKPVQVEVLDPDISTLQLIRNLIGPSLNVTVTLFLVTFFCIFMLIARDDLRARLVRVVGARNSKVTNLLLEETGRRLSRYLLMQLIVNIGYGVSIGLGTWAIGIPHHLLWGMIGGLFRYIPYAGAWLAAAMAFAVAFAIAPGWSQPLLVFALFAIAETFTANFVEPWVYANSTGVTPLAILFAAVFWTWLWGPIGLLLSIPLTVCLISVARFVPQMEMLDQLFGDAQP